jgi:hypothetical protein
MLATFHRPSTRSLLLLAVSFLLPMHNAVACISIGDSFTLPLFIVVFIVILIFTIALTAVVFGIKQVFFRRANNLTILSLVSIILAIVLGLFATFAVPHFESIFQSYGAELPLPTTLVFRFHFLLWLPLLLIAISYRRLRLQATYSRYYLLVVMGETMLLLLVLMALYVPIFKLGCVV